MPIGTPVDLGHNANAATPPSLAITTLAQVNAGDLIVLFHYANATTGPVSGVTDDAGNVYTLAYSFVTAAPVIECYYCANALPLSPGQAITAAFSGAALRHGITAFTVSGMLSATPVDAISATASATSTTDGTVSTGALAQPLELVVGCVVAGGALGTIVQGAGFTPVGGSFATAILAPAYQAVNSTNSVSYSPSWANSVLSRIRVMSFKGIPDPVVVPTTPPNTGGAVVGGRRRQILGREKPQAESRWTRETPPQVIKPTARQSGTTPQSPSIEDVKPAISSEAVAEPGDKHIKPAPTVHKPAPKVAKPSGPTWADMARARVELTRLRQELADQQDEDDVELLLVSLH